MVPVLAAAGMESYGNAYPSLVQLQVLQELQSASQLLRTTQQAPNLACGEQLLAGMLDLWSSRLKHMSSSLHTLESLFAKIEAANARDRESFKHVNRTVSVSIVECFAEEFADLLTIPRSQQSWQEVIPA